MDLRSSSPFSLMKNGIINVYPSLNKSFKTEVVIIGAGITGALVAWHLCNAGVEVCMLDRRHAGMGSTAASTSLLQYEIDVPLYKLSESVGEANAARSYLLCRKSIFDLEEICAGLPQDAGFKLKQSFQYASYKKDINGLEKEFRLRKKYGISLDWLEQKEVEKKFGFSAPAGLLSKDGGLVDAYVLTHALLGQAGSKGVKVYDNTDVIAIKENKKNVEITTDNHCKIVARHVIVASGYESQRYISKKIEELNSTYAIVSEPLTEKKHWHKNCLIWETATPYLYIRLTDDNRIIIGGKDDKFYNPGKRDESLPVKRKQLEKSFQKLFPGIPFKTDFQWAGTFGSSKDGLPYVGSLSGRPNISFALGFGGNGITFSVIAAQIIRDLVTGKPNKDASIFAFDR